MVNEHFTMNENFINFHVFVTHVVNEINIFNFSPNENRNLKISQPLRILTLLFEGR